MALLTKQKFNSEGSGFACHLKPVLSQHFAKKVLLLDFLHIFTSFVPSLCLFMNNFTGCMAVTPSSTHLSFLQQPTPENIAYLLGNGLSELHHSKDSNCFSLFTALG